MSIPNILSIFRLLLIPIFVITFLLYGDESSVIPAIILLISGVTDMADGFIARRYNMITDLGKILDPLADKLTLFFVCLTLSTRYPSLLVLTGVFFIKELLMLIGGIVVFKKGGKVQSSKWFGKMATALMYCTLILVIITTELTDVSQHILVIAMIIVLIFTLIMYIPTYLRIKRDQNN